MRFVIFCHSLVSDWSNGSAHFLRGIVSELMFAGHGVRVYEPRDASSVQHLLADQGSGALTAFQRAYPGLQPHRYDPASIDLDGELDGADVVIVHEWNDPALVARIGARRAAGGRFLLLFHDTHHRAVTAPAEMARYDLRSYDGVLAAGDVIREQYMERGWTQRAWTWHEAADTRVFRPAPRGYTEGDVVWIGNWDDDERSVELGEFLVEPVRDLGLRAAAYGVGYPEAALALLVGAGIDYRGWLPNFQVPRVFARYSVTVHVPRRPYMRAVRGIPTIRPFEALACGIPMVSAPWDDADQLFTPGADFLLARDGREMRRHLRDLLNDASYADAIAARGRSTILQRHTCAHRVSELLRICHRLTPARPEPVPLDARSRTSRRELSP